MVASAVLEVPGDVPPTSLLVVCDQRPAAASAASPPFGGFVLAERLARQQSWGTLSVELATGGDATCSRRALDDVSSVVEGASARTGGPKLWLAGFGEAGALCVCLAAEDPRVRGLALFGAPADLSDYMLAPPEDSPSPRAGSLTEKAEPRGTRRAVGDAGAVAYDDHLHPLEEMSKIPPRPVLVVHGSEDDVVSLLDPRALVDAADFHAELRILQGAGHVLRHDPRALAVLLGWLERNGRA